MEGKTPKRKEREESSMKIGLFTDTFYPEINGVATSCLNL